MNQVDIYIGDYRLDLFQDEEIGINLSVQNIQDISKVFTDFTQSFTVPASGINNEIFKHYYRTDVDASRITTSSTTNYPIWNDWIGAWETQLQTWGGGSSSTSVANTYDYRLRVAARIEINSIPFRTGVIELENVSMKGTEPYAYSIGFYGDLVSLVDLFGEDYLYDLDLSAYDHTYDGATILQGFNQDALFSGEVFYPLMSPVKNWVYDVAAGDINHDNDIHYDTATGHSHGINYYELKPALKITKILEAIGTKYGITFTGDILTDADFEKLYLWAHRKEGYTYFGQPAAMEGQHINFNSLVSGTFDLTNDWWVVPNLFPAEVENIQFLYNIDNITYPEPFYIDLYKDDVLISTNQHTGNVTAGSFSQIKVKEGEIYYIKFRPSTNTNVNYRVYQFIGYRQGTLIKYFEVAQTLYATYFGDSVQMSNLMPEMKVKDFVSGIVRMHNMVITPTNATTFNLQPLEDWYADGVDQDLTQYIDIEEVEINRPSLYRQIKFNYQETNQILGKQYALTNPTPFGDLKADFSFDGGEFEVKLPFECPLFERLTDYKGHHGGTPTLTNVLVYKSITMEADQEGQFNPYLGKAVIIYGEFGLDISANPIGFRDENDVLQPQIDEVWYANVSSTFAGIGLAKSLTWGSDIDPYHLQAGTQSLYNEYWADYIEDLYDSKRRIVKVKAQLPLGKIIGFDLKNKIIWNNQKWIVNSASVNMTTGKTSLELLNVV